MRIGFTQGDFGTYEVFPVTSKGKQFKRDPLKGAFGPEGSILVRTDWDYPGLARTFGWNGKIGREKCRHSGTDGTIKCPDCGRGASEFIKAAADWLDSHEGKTAEDPGYFE